MNPGYQTLTDREKETLRLLVCGYDAKSMARHLGLSVHTINERLRDARRKMAVSSSREAARQLRELEAGPQLCGDDRIGGDPVARAMQPQSAPATNAGATPRAIWAAGGIVMSLSLALLILAALPGTAPTPAGALGAPLSSKPANYAPANGAAAQWLALVDRAEWNESWDATGQSFKALNTSAKWAEVSEQVRRPLGKVLSRTFVSEEDIPAPPYGYQVVKFRTSFANRTNATETLSLTFEAGQWKVVGYIISEPD